MKPSLKIIAFIKNYEQLHDGDLNRIGLQPKPDAVGNWTEGYGKLMTLHGQILTTKTHPTIESVLPYQTIRTEKDAIRALELAILDFAKGVNRRLQVEVSQHQFDALVSHAYNCGFSEGLYRLVNSCATEKEIYIWFTTKYITANGVMLRGLRYRRNDEYEIWSGLNYDRDYNLRVAA